MDVDTAATTAHAGSLDSASAILALCKYLLSVCLILLDM